MSENVVNSDNLEVTVSNDNVQDSENLEVVEIVPGFSSFDDFVKSGFDVIKTGIKASNSLPSEENFNYYACFSSFNNFRNGEINKILNSMQNVIELAGVSGNIKRHDIEEKFELLLEANDVFLDRAGVCMDEESGVTKNPGVELIVSQTRVQNINGSWNATTSHPNHRLSESLDSAPAIRLLAARNIHRPQLTFKDKIDNSLKPWEPRIKDKPNSLKPLALYLEETVDGEAFNHPYEVELNKFVPPDKQLQMSTPIKYKSLDDTPLIIVEKPEDIKILLDDLQKYDEIAIDLEHHSYRSFQGITCLMQISTRDTDYLIDTLVLRSELHVLNEIFTKSSILKVFHGADMDIQWLQRDLSLYVVNMFDTHRAAKQLNLPYLSLAFLLKRYCGVDPNKHFQLADWRIRPLPEELMKYAREDTHYLLYIKDMLRNILIEEANGQSNILKAVYDQSTEVCKLIYVKPIWRENSYMGMYRKSQKMFNNKQLYALKELHRWRDVTARQEDDSTGYVLPNHMLLNIAETLPREMQGILACCNPIPPLVRQNLLKLHKIILKAREQPLIKPVLEEDIRQRMTQRNQVMAETENWLHCPHDMLNNIEPRADLPCLLDSDRSTEISSLEESTEITHRVTVFDSPPVSEDDGTMRNEMTLKKKKVFMSPFERYKRVFPMIAAEEAKERERQEKENAERLAKEEKERQEIADSKNRVYEHFKETVATVNNDVNVSDPKQHRATRVTLRQMHGKKRKRQLDQDDRSNLDTKSEHDLLTPVPSLDVKIMQGFKRKNECKEDIREQYQIKKSSKDIEQEPVQDTETVKSMRCRKKGDKRVNNKELLEKNMLPQKTFNYKTVDFSSFQGGSKTNVTPTLLTLAKNKEKNAKRGKGKRRKQKRG